MCVGTGLTKVKIRMKGRKLDLSFASRSAGSGPAHNKALVMHLISVWPSLLNLVGP